MDSKSRPRVLIAVQPSAWPLLKGMLEDIADVVPAYTVDEALQILQAADVDLVLATLTFSESRMLEFLVALKAEPTTSRIPFLCCRAVVGILSEQLVESLGTAAKLCGAKDFVNIGNLSSEQARDALRAAVLKCLA